MSPPPSTLPLPEFFSPIRSLVKKASCQEPSPQKFELRGEEAQEKVVLVGFEQVSVRTNNGKKYNKIEHG